MTTLADVTDPRFTADQLATVEVFDAGTAPESDDPALWATLSDLIPCNDFVGCVDECECAEGELRLAVMRLIVAERVHHADCGDDEDCCTATEHRARLVNKAAALTADRLRDRRTALRGGPQPTVAAVAAYRATQDGGAEEAVRRVEALCDETENRWPDFSPAGDPLPYVVETSTVRAALAPQAGDGAR